MPCPMDKVCNPSPISEVWPHCLRVLCWLVLACHILPCCCSCGSLECFSNVFIVISTPTQPPPCFVSYSVFPSKGRTFSSRSSPSLEARMWKGRPSAPVPSVAIKPSYEVFSTSVTDGSKKPSALGTQRQRLGTPVVPTSDSQGLHNGSWLLHLHSTISLLESRSTFCEAPVLSSACHRHDRLYEVPS